MWLDEFDKISEATPLLPWFSATFWGVWGLAWVLFNI